MTKLIGNIAILISGSILMFGGLLAIGILLFAATPVAVARRLSSGRVRIET